MLIFWKTNIIIFFFLRWLYLGFSRSHHSESSSSIPPSFPVLCMSFLTTTQSPLCLLARSLHLKHPSANIPTLPLMCSFLILSILIPPKEILNIFNSATFLSSGWSVPTLPNQATLPVLLLLLQTFPFPFAAHFLSQITSDSSPAYPSSLYRII